MTVNTHFNHFQNQTAEQSLIDDLNTEIIQMAGMDLVYIPRDAVDPDHLYHEDYLNTFTSNHTLEFYLKSVDGFGADLDLITQFGLELNETATWECSITRFGEVITVAVPTITHPREGDLLYIPMTKSLMEINKVKADDPFYQRGKNYRYELICELFEYSQETVSTGNADVDDLLAGFDTTVDIANDPEQDNTNIENDAINIRTFDESNVFGDY